MGKPPPTRYPNLNNERGTSRIESGIASPYPVRPTPDTDRLAVAAMKKPTMHGNWDSGWNSAVDAVLDLIAAGVGFRDEIDVERLREDGEGGYFIPVRHYPSDFVALAGHPQLGGQFCKEDGGDWPCAAVREAIAREYAKDGSEP